MTHVVVVFCIPQCRLLVVEEKEELVSRRELHCSVR